jgi:hypothetical protein
MMLEIDATVPKLMTYDICLLDVYQIKRATLKAFIVSGKVKVFFLKRGWEAFLAFPFLVYQ